MRSRAGTRLEGRAKILAYSLVAALVVLTAVAGFAFVMSRSVGSIADNARRLQWANVVAGQSALANAGAVQAVTLAELAESDLLPEGSAEHAIAELGDAIGVLEGLIIEGLEMSPAGELEQFTASLSAVKELLVEGDHDSARDLYQSQTAPDYDSLAESVASQQERVSTAIDENTEAGRSFNSWFVFVITLLVPGSAVVVYFVATRRQVRRLTERAELELEAEREISRAKDSFIAGLSHELRTPLTSIYGFSEILAEGGDIGTEASAEMARVVADQAAELTRMVDDLLVASRFDSIGVAVDRTTVELDAVIASAVAPFERAGEKVSWQPTSTSLVTDGARLRHILVNLISNAVKHGGAKIGIAVRAGDGPVHIAVWDNGDGVPLEMEERMFERFVHRDEAPLLAGSVGLGLAVAGRLAVALGGAITYTRDHERTHFVVSLPSKPKLEDRPASATSEELDEITAEHDLTDEKALTP